MQIAEISKKAIQYTSYCQIQKYPAFFFAEKSFIKLVKCAGFPVSLNLSHQTRTNNNLIWTEKIF
ncbi:hypothetical protein A1704_22345 [Chryseobacterium cucumeris]|nr:hypothetical protein A1704_22345 [Chryseobacterium cucumeris]